MIRIDAMDDIELKLNDMALKTSCRTAAASAAAVVSPIFMDCATIGCYPTKDHIKTAVDENLRDMVYMRNSLLLLSSLHSDSEAF